MVATIKQIIGKINPWLYAENGKELLKKYGSPEKIPAEEVKPKPVLEHWLVYDSTSETLEPVYFFILDLMNLRGLQTEKLIDNFSSSPGSGHFGELGQRATVMQQQGVKILGDVNTVLRSVLNIIYDLKEFRIRLQYYNDLKTKDKEKSEAARLALKQIWMDKVDINKGNSSIKAMAVQQVGAYQTLIDAFLIARDESLRWPNGKEIDLNERVKRILSARIKEFNIWLSQSEMELKKRYELEKTYLRSQVNSLKLYARWAKPYLAAAQKLESTEPGREPALVKVFNSILLELALFGKSPIDPKKLAVAGNLPEEFTNDAFLKTIKRKYYGCALVDFKFRGIPQRIGGQQSHYVFGGRADVYFSAYSLNEDEIKKINEELEKSDQEDVLKLIEGATTESLNQLQEEINFFLEEKTKEEEKEISTDGSNPFLALLGFYNNKNQPKKETKTEKKSIRPDNWVEKTQLRIAAKKAAIDNVFNLFDIYKKLHHMPNYGG
ncbi:MAG: hypothetical protein ABIH49_00765 [archaeon]